MALYRGAVNRGSTVHVCMYVYVYMCVCVCMPMRMYGHTHLGVDMGIHVVKYVEAASIAPPHQPSFKECLLLQVKYERVSANQVVISD